MTKDFQRIEAAIHMSVGKILTWLIFLTWLFCCRCYTYGGRFGSWLLQRVAKRKASMKPRAPAPANPA